MACPKHLCSQRWDRRAMPQAEPSHWWHQNTLKRELRDSSPAFRKLYKNFFHPPSFYSGLVSTDALYSAVLNTSQQKWKEYLTVNPFVFPSVGKKATRCKTEFSDCSDLSSFYCFREVPQSARMCYLWTLPQPVNCPWLTLLCISSFDCGKLSRDSS